jgi:hypothetical protein
MKNSRFVRGFGIILLVIFAILLVGPFLIPVPPLENTVPAESLADDDSRFIEVNGVNIHYKIVGDGEARFHSFAWVWRKSFLVA